MRGRVFARAEGSIVAACGPSAAEMTCARSTASPAYAVPQAKREGGRGSARVGAAQTGARMAAAYVLRWMLAGRGPRPADLAAGAHPQ